MLKPPAHTISLGCRLNAYESERMAPLAANASDGAAVVINTCAVTNEAVRQSRQAIRRAHKDHPNAHIIATGCAVQLDPKGFSAMPEVDRVIGNAEKLDPAAWSPAAQPIDQPVGDVFAATTLNQAPAPRPGGPVRAHLEVQNGCDHRCTFCIIPFGRGGARSKRPGAVLAEAKNVVAAGAKEIVLTGVDLTSYGPDLGPGVTLSDAIEALLVGLPTDITLRLSSIDGAEVDDRLFALVTQEDRIAPHVHLSLQAGDDMILKRMKRRHSRAEAVDLCTRLKTARGHIALGADLIAGFPTETDAMFAHTQALVADCQLAYAHIFPFSPRQGTPAARMPQLDRATIKARAAQLRAAADAAKACHLQAKVGTQDRVLIEQHKDGQAWGKTPDFTDVAVDTMSPIGASIAVRFHTHTPHHLLGSPAAPSGKDHHHG